MPQYQKVVNVYENPATSIVTLELKCGHAKNLTFAQRHDYMEHLWKDRELHGAICGECPDLPDPIEWPDWKDAYWDACFGN